MNYLTIGPLRISRDSLGEVRVTCMIDGTDDDGTKREILNARLSAFEISELHNLTRTE